MTGELEAIGEELIVALTTSGPCEEDVARVYVTQLLQRILYALKGQSWPVPSEWLAKSSQGDVAYSQDCLVTKEPRKINFREFL